MTKASARAGLYAGMIVREHGAGLVWRILPDRTGNPSVYHSCVWKDVTWLTIGLFAVYAHWEKTQPIDISSMLAEELLGDTTHLPLDNFEACASWLLWKQVATLGATQLSDMVCRFGINKMYQELHYRIEAEKKPTLDVLVSRMQERRFSPRARQTARIE